MKRIGDWLALTAMERKVILFLAAAMLAGAAIRLYQQTFRGGARYDYRAMDSTFAALSAAPIDSVRQSAHKGTITRLNINTATKQELMELPGIGAITADRILKRREELGRFAMVEDLRTIKGMSAKKIELLKPLMTTH